MADIQRFDHVTFRDGPAGDKIGQIMSCLFTIIDPNDSNRKDPWQGWYVVEPNGIERLVCRDNVLTVRKWEGVTSE